MIKDVMNGVERVIPQVCVPLVIDLNSGENWGMLH